MKSLPRKTALAVSTLFATGLFPAHAEDIDLYVSGSPIQNSPNVLPAPWRAKRGCHCVLT